MNHKISFFIIICSMIIKLIAISITNFDLFGDEAQYWLWSEEPLAGYYSKPPLLAWLLVFHTNIFGDSFEALKYFPLIFYIFTPLVIYFLSNELFEEKKISVIAAVSFYLLPSVSLSSFLISTDVVLIFFCSLCMLVLLRIRKNPSIINFTILGVFFGLAFLTKYAAIYYIFSLILISVLDGRLRKAFYCNFLNLVVFIVCVIIVLLPNILWNAQNGWVTLSHTSDNAGLSRVSFSLLNGVEFILSQALMLGPILFLSFLINIKKIKLNFQTKFLLSFSFPVFFIIFLESIFVRANANWAAVGLVPIFLLMINNAYFFAKKFIIYNNFLNFAFCLFLFFLIATSSNLKIFDRINGISYFSENLSSDYLKNINYLIVEDRLLFSNLVYLLKDTNKNILTTYNPKNEVKSHFHLTSPLKANHSENFVFIGNLSSLNYLEKEFVVVEKEEISVRFVSQSLKIYEIIF